MIVKFYVKIVPFTSVAKRHLTVLGLDFSYDLELNDKLVRAANERNSFSNSSLRQDSLKAVQKHFNVSVSSPSGAA